jgi:membrane associated rhomboid family serine protease
MITYTIVFITAGISLLAMKNDEIKNRFMFNAYAISRYREWWRFFTHGVLHADFVHLLFNMLSLYFFGPIVEQTFKAEGVFGPVLGGIVYAVFYILALAASSLYSFSKHKNNSSYNALGASGAVSAIIFAAILIMPTMDIVVQFILPIPAWLYGPLFLVYSSYKSKRGDDNIGHDAHFWGAVYGFVIPIILKPFLFSLFIIQLRDYFLYHGIPH